ncbi:hypothetical protein L210DRAFT_2735958 [Boletus edulis BED1]|uniref:Uncharacterized protein n=1 Tax=Boletus edulis BED1 TaxID=1328754 RepID=A0AAD4BKL6_BOLED|nr:hypothetical protein L210DRAFT_2735958 [Boletus edulis BED1]
MPTTMPQDKFTQLRQTYKYNNEAEALFFKDKFQRPALRLEVPDLNLEFTDGFYIGSDPKGRFYYNDDFKKLDKQKGPKSKYTVESAFVDFEVYVDIKFYDPNAQPGSGPYAEFFARDPQNLAAGSGLVGLTDRTGNWTNQSYSRNSATVEKAAGNAHVSITSLTSSGTASRSTDCSTSKTLTRSILRIMQGGTPITLSFMTMTTLVEISLDFSSLSRVMGRRK